jgi:CPA1 family monovalent cation:H+ antiporter
MLEVAALVITLTALFAYINFRYIRLPTTIGVMVISLAMSLGLLGLGLVGHAQLARQVEALLGEVDFNEILMRGMLSILLFAGALHIDLEELTSRKWPIGVLATVGVVTSTLLVGFAFWAVLGMVGLQVPLIHCLVFGALISPTDPIAVLGILKSADTPRSLEIKIAGESLFNDGVAVVVFAVLMDLARGGHDVSAAGVALLLLEEAVGGILFGLVIGWLAYRMLKSIDAYQVEVLITLALVLGGYALALHLHVSGPLAMVVAGLLIGNRGRVFAMSDTTRDHLDTFWELMDEILNAVLFVLIGFELVILAFDVSYLWVAALMIPLVLLARFVSVGVPITIMRRRFEISPHAIKILSWGGVRGGISLALALSLPRGSEREVILFVTYAVVVFSILVQGLTLGRLVRATSRAESRTL